MAYVTNVSKLNDIEIIYENLDNLDGLRHRKTGVTTSQALMFIGSAMSRPEAQRNQSFKDEKDMEIFESKVMEILATLDLKFFKIKRRDTISLSIIYQPFFNDNELMKALCEYNKGQK